MKSTTLFALVLVLALALPAAALAKGPTAAKIEGPGLDRAIALSGDGEDGGASAFGRFVESAGFFPAMFGQSPDPMQAKRPARVLGPRYTVTHEVPGPNGVDTVVQHLYPYAFGSPVVYTKPGQPFFGSQRTHGGWYLALPSLKANLVAAGLPARTPGATASFWTVPTLASLSAAIAAPLALLGFAAFRLRHRAKP